MNILLRILVYSLILNLTGCAGCSKSGRESIRKKNLNSSEKSREVESQKPLPSKPEQYIPGSEGGSNDNLTTLYNLNRKGVFVVYSTNGGSSGSQGTGFFVSSDGLAVSNKHVFDDYNQHFVKLYDGTSLEVTEILRQSEDFDYVIFRVGLGSTGIRPIAIALNEPQVGEDVFAIGNPKGLEQTLSKGIVSGYRENRKYIQTTAEITNGSSGGPLFNMDERAHV